MSYSGQITRENVFSSLSANRNNMGKKPRKDLSLSGRTFTYYNALFLIELIDANLDLGTRHYRTRAGQLLSTLEQVVQAILSNDLGEILPNEETGVQSP